MHISSNAHSTHHAHADVGVWHLTRCAAICESHTGQTHVWCVTKRSRACPVILHICYTQGYGILGCFRLLSGYLFLVCTERGYGGSICGAHMAPSVLASDL